MIKEKSVLVLGVGPDQGLGVALCKQFAEEGYKVFGCGRSKENMDALKKVKVSKGSIEGIVGDVTNPEDVLNIFSQLDEAEVKLESVIYNAGNNNAKPFLEMDLDFFQDYLLIPSNQAEYVNNPRHIFRGYIILDRLCIWVIFIK